jgi:hypothetical protein
VIFSQNHTFSPPKKAGVDKNTDLANQRPKNWTQSSRGQRSGGTAEQQQRRGRKDLEKTKMAKLDTTSAGDTTARREVKEDSSSENGGTGGSCDDSSNGDASSAGRDKEIGGGGGKQGILT